MSEIIDQYGIKESKDILAPIKTAKEIAKDIKENGFQFSRTLGKSLPLISELEQAYSGAGLVWKNELPDATDAELAELEGIFDDILENQNYGDMAGGLIKILRGLVRQLHANQAQIIQLTNENTSLRQQVAKAA